MLGQGEHRSHVAEETGGQRERKDGAWVVTQRRSADFRDQRDQQVLRGDRVAADGCRERMGEVAQELVVGVCPVGHLDHAGRTVGDPCKVAEAEASHRELGQCLDERGALGDLHGRAQHLGGSWHGTGGELEAPEDDQGPATGRGVGRVVQDPPGQRPCAGYVACQQRVLGRSGQELRCARRVAGNHGGALENCRLAPGRRRTPPSTGWRRPGGRAPRPATRRPCCSPRPGATPRPVAGTFSTASSPAGGGPVVVRRRSRH